MRVLTLGAMGRISLVFGAMVLGVLASHQPLRAATLPSNLTYSTAARLSAAGLPLTFEGVQNATMPTSGPIRLGRFVVTKPRTGGDVDFDNAAFAVEFNAPKYHKVEPTSDPNSALSSVQFDGIFALEGRLNGTVFADGRSTLKATLDGVTTRGLNQTSLDRTYVDNLPFSVANVQVAPELDLSSGPGGLAGVEISAQIVDPSSMAATAAAPIGQPVPEPSSVVVFLAAACGLLVVKRRRA